MLESLFATMNEKNKRLAVVGGIGAATLLLIWMMAAQPAIKKNKATENQKKELREKEPMLRGVLDTETRLAAYPAKLAEDRDLGPLMEDLSKMAEQSSLQNVSIALEKGAMTQDVDVEKLSISIEGVGNFHQLGDFVSRVENLERFAKISRVEFGRSGSGIGSASLTNDSRTSSKRISVIVSTFFAAKDLTL